MSIKEVAALEKRIQDLESELQDRERDLQTYKDQVRQANTQIEKLISQIQEQVRVASLIQKSLVPTEFPNIPGFEFSTKFIASMISGGDYFDIFEHEDKFRFGIVMANSSGYGMSALLMSVLLKLTGQLEARKGLAADRVLELLAKELIANIKGDDLAHIFYCVVDRRNFSLSCSGVGQYIALLYRYGDNKVERIDFKTAPFSSNFSQTFALQEFSLNPRDRLILCTQGVVKAQNPKGDSFGEDRLYKAVLSAPKTGVHELRNEILFQVEKFSQGKDYPQDLTVIVAEVKDRVIKLAKSLDQ